MIWKNFTGLVLLAAGLSHAHLVATSLMPKGGETLKVGDNISISWAADQNHGDGIDIALSKNGGTSWTVLRAGFNDNAIQNTFKWTITADAVTQNGLFRICQSGPCTDAMKTSRATGNGGPWYLVSGVVKIQAATALAEAAGAARDLSMDFNPATRNVEVSFGLSRPQDVLLQAFDAQGRLVATLLQGNYATGSHTLSVFSNRLVQGAGSLVFKLQVGEQVKTHTWLSAR
jgi:hypothetical protein